MDWLHAHHCTVLGKKPIEIYYFIDPLCPECWGMEPILKKVQMEYGNIVNIKHVLTGKQTSLSYQKELKDPSQLATVWERTASRTGMSCDGDIWLTSAVPSHVPYRASLAIKAAELQGKKNGIRFLRKLQEFLFLEKKNISNIKVLAECAKAANIDPDEFLQDIHSDAAVKALQCDLKITEEMDVQESPSLVIFNENIEEEGIKVSGIYSYDIYLSILAEMMPSLPPPSPLPKIEHFIRFFNVVATKEIAVVYDMQEQEVEREMKKLRLRRVVEQIPGKFGTFWRYIPSN
ncbi:MAG: ClpXP adapter SpxH family protein [Bacillus sp. (in: firmicutes)]